MMPLKDTRRIPPRHGTCLEKLFNSILYTTHLAIDAAQRITMRRRDNSNREAEKICRKDTGPLDVWCCVGGVFDSEEVKRLTGERLSVLMPLRFKIQGSVALVSMDFRRLVKSLNVSSRY